MPLLRFFLIFVLLFVAAGGASADEYTVTAIGNDEITCRFEDNRINAIYKDSDGFVWIGTGATVERVGGRRSLAYHFAEERQGIAPAPFLVNALIEAQKHELWAATIQGVWRMNHVARTMERMFADEINFPVQALGKDESGTLYIATTNGLYIYDGSRLRHIVMDEKNAISARNLIMDIAVVGSQEAWLLTAEGLVLCDTRSGALKFYPCPLASAGRLFCLVEREGCLYIGTQQGEVITFDLSKRTFSSFWKSDVQVPVVALDWEAGLLGVATKGQGLYLLSASDGETMCHFTYDGETGQGLLSNMLSSVLLAGDEIWCGTDYYQGMNLLKKRDASYRRYARGLFTRHDVGVRSFLKTGHYTFVGTREGFYCVDERTGNIRLVSVSRAGEGHLRSNLIFSFFDNGDEVWVGTCGGGLAVFNPKDGTFRETPLTRTCVSNDIFMFQDDGDGLVWLAASDGLYSYDRRSGDIRDYNASGSGMPGNIVYGIYVDSKQRFWVGTDKGLTLFDRSTGRCSSAGLPSVCSAAVRSIYEGRDGTLFFCLLDNRLLVADNELKHFRMLDAVRCHTVMQDSLGFYWLGDATGLLRMDEKLEGYRLFGMEAGLSVSSGAPIAKDENGQLWVCATKGVYTIIPQQEYPDLSVRITEMFVNGKPYADHYVLCSDTVLVLEPDENTVTFQFFPLGYRAPGQARYQYMLEGKDSTWIDLSGEDKVSFFGLPSGQYKFRVREYMNRDSEDFVSFVVGTQRSWLLYVVVLGGVLAISAFVVYRIRNRKPVADVQVESPVQALPPVQPSEPAPEAVQSSAESYSKLNEAEAQAVIEALKRYMEEQQPYLNVDLKQSDVAVAVGYPTYLLSAVFTHHLKMGYYDFVNSYRVERFKQSVAEGLHKKYTLVTLAEKCGFKSKASFFRAFKKFTGSTPSEYIQQHGGE